MYFVLHSTDSFLLARMATDLQLAGWDNVDDNDGPLNEEFRPDRPFLMIYKDLGRFHFNNHPGVDNPTRFALTESNYITVLTKILCEK